MKLKSRVYNSTTKIIGKPKDILLISDFYDTRDKMVEKFEKKHKCIVKFNIENLTIKKTK